MTNNNNNNNNTNNTLSIKRLRIESRQQTHPLLSDIVALLPSAFTAFLPPEDVLRLLTHCSPLLSQDVCDAVAAQGLATFYAREEQEAQVGSGCMRDWTRLVLWNSPLDHLDGYRCSHSYLSCRTPSTNDLSLPTRRHLLEALCVVHKGIRPHCFRVLQLDRSFARRQYGVLQPVVLALAAMEEPSMGTTTATATTATTSMVEAHWNGIHVDVAGDATHCVFCDANALSMIDGPLNPQFRPAEYEFLLRQHCRDVYQPLKRFMARHLQHVRYVRFPRRYTKVNDRYTEVNGSATGDNNNNNNNSEWIDVIVGCTTGGVLCGVYLTEVRLPRASAAHGLAPGAYPFDASAIDRTRLRITY